MGKWCLVVIWECPQERTVYEYDTEDQARSAEHGMKIALGNQIAGTCIYQQFN